LALNYFLDVLFHFIGGEPHGFVGSQALSGPFSVTIETHRSEKSHNGPLPRYRQMISSKLLIFYKYNSSFLNLQNNPFKTLKNIPAWILGSQIRRKFIGEISF